MKKFSRFCLQSCLQSVEVKELLNLVSLEIVAFNLIL